MKSTSQKYVKHNIYLEMDFYDLIDTIRTKVILTSKIYASIQNYSEIDQKYGVQEQKLKNSSFSALLEKSFVFQLFSVF